MIDQLNNSIGREIAINSPTANNKELAYMILIILLKWDYTRQKDLTLTYIML